jgi:hypothetical protein
VASSTESLSCVVMTMASSECVASLMLTGNTGLIILVVQNLLVGYRRCLLAS